MCGKLARTLCAAARGGENNHSPKMSSSLHVVIAIAAQAFTLSPQYGKFSHLQAHAACVFGCRASTPVLCAESAKKLSEYERLQSQLADAVAAEDYKAAALLRDELDGIVVDDQMELMSVNNEFYAAFTAGDFERMEKVWDDKDAYMTCIHPTQAPLYGRDDVMESWKQILGQGGGMEIKADNVRCVLLGTSAIITCFERVNGATPLVATNIFAKNSEGRWRMVLHQAGAVLQLGNSESPDATGDSA